MIEQPTEPPGREELLRRGREVQEQLTGAAAAAHTRAGSNALVPDLGQISDEVNWGRIWAREGLDLRTRCFCVISCLLALGRYPQVFAHMQGARRVGVSQQELAEAVMQLTFYAGLPVVHEGLALVKRAYEEPLLPE